MDFEYYLLGALRALLIVVLVLLTAAGLFACYHIVGAWGLIPGAFIITPLLMMAQDLRLELRA